MTIINKVLRKLYLRKYRNVDKEITIFSNNCIGGFLYQNMKAQYQSPTIGVQIPLSDFLKYVINYQHYLEADLLQCPPLQAEFSDVGGGIVNFPCAILDDVRIMFQHGNSFNEEKAKWVIRSKRINRNKIIVVVWAYNYQINQEIVSLFNSIPFKKILLTDKPINYETLSNCFVIEAPYNKKWYSFNGHKRFFEKYNWPKFLKIDF